MNVVFADTFYFFALLSKSDEAHARTVEFTRSYRGKFVTTEWVLTELADGLAATPSGRTQFLQTLDRLFRQINRQQGHGISPKFILTYGGVPPHWGSDRSEQVLLVPAIGRAN